MFDWYRRYRTRKTLARKLIEARMYIREGYNIRSTIERIRDIGREIDKIEEQLKNEN